MSNERRPIRPRGGFGRGPHGRGEKPKDFKTAVKKLTISLKNFWPAIIISFILAGVGSILTIIAPNRLSDLTNELTNGLVPNTEVLTDLTNTITKNLDEEYMSNTFMQILDLDFSENRIKDLLNDKSLGKEEKQEIQNFIKNLNNENMITSFNKLSISTKELLLEETVFRGVTVSINDKIALLNILENNSLDLKNIPEKIKNVVFPEINYKGIILTSSDQVTFISALSEVSDMTNQKEIFDALDKLPENIYDLVKPTVNFNMVKHLVLIIALLYGFTAIFSFVQGLIMVYVSNNYSRDLRNDISGKINRLPLKYFDKNTVGDTLSLVTNDVDTMAQSMNQSFSTLISSLTMFVGAIIMMFYTNGIMAITAIVSSLLGFIFMFAILGKSQKYFTERQIQIANMNGHIEETFSGHNVVTLYNGKNQVDKTFDELNEKLFECDYKSHFLSGLMQPIMGFIGNFGYVAVCIVGAILTMNGHITFGVIVAFTMYVRLFTNPLSQIAQSMTSLQSTAAASERVFEFLEQNEMEDESKKTKKLLRNEVKGEIEFKNVKFGYDDKLIIKDFSAHVKPGQKIAIVGPTGAGKTTLVNLLMKFYELNSGEILIDGVSTTELTRDNIHNLFIMVLQDTWLFNGTIRDNIRYNKENVTDKQIWDVCDVVGVSHYIKTLPNGLDSEITDANSISSGQKQLLTIARGMIEDAPFLILDEATSNVDTRTEELVQKAMDKLTEGRTSFIIAHRLSTIKNADLILVMDNGNIIETGNHDELMKQNGFYANLYNSQFEKLSE